MIEILYFSQKVCIMLKKLYIFLEVPNFSEKKTYPFNGFDHIEQPENDRFKVVRKTP